MNREPSLGGSHKKFRVFDTVLVATTITFAVGGLLWVVGKAGRHLFAGDARAWRIGGADATK